jgi:hypothetical protein
MGFYQQRLWASKVDTMTVIHYLTLGAIDIDIKLQGMTVTAMVAISY